MKMHFGVNGIDAVGTIGETLDDRGEQTNRALKTKGKRAGFKPWRFFAEH